MAEACCEFCDPAAATGVQDAAGKYLTVGTLLPMTGGWDGGKTMYPAALKAVQEVNADPSILAAGVTMRLYLNDSSCDTDVGVKVGVHQLTVLNPDLHALFGAGCSSVSQEVAYFSQHWRVTQVSPSSTSPRLTDIDDFPYFFRTVPTDNAFAFAWFALCEYFGWTEVATVHQNEELHSYPTLEFHSLLQRNNYTLASSSVFGDPSEDDMAAIVQTLIDAEARIIVGEFHESSARAIMCEAYKSGFYGHGITWLMVGWLSDDWWVPSDEHNEPWVTCTASQLRTAAAGSVLTEALDTGDDEGGLTPGGDLPSTWWAEFLSSFPDAVSESSFAYDAIWALAFAFDKVLTNQTSFDDLNTPHHQNDTSAAALVEAMQATDFQGASGHIAFDTNQDREADLRIEQMQSGEQISIALFSQQAIVWTAAVDVVWSDGASGLDSAPASTFSCAELRETEFYTGDCAATNDDEHGDKALETVVIAVLVVAGFLTALLEVQRRKVAQQKKIAQELTKGEEAFQYVSPGKLHTKWLEMQVKVQVIYLFAETFDCVTDILSYGEIRQQSTTGVIVTYTILLAMALAVSFFNAFIRVSLVKECRDNLRRGFSLIHLKTAASRADGIVWQADDLDHDLAEQIKLKKSDLNVLVKKLRNTEASILQAFIEDLPMIVLNWYVIVQKRLSVSEGVVIYASTCVNLLLMGVKLRGIDVWAMNNHNRKEKENDIAELAQRRTANFKQMLKEARNNEPDNNGQPGNRQLVVREREAQSEQMRDADSTTDN